MKTQRFIHFSWIILILCCISASAAERSKPRPSAAQKYIHAALKACDNSKAQLPEMIRVAEVIAERHIAGGMIGFPRLAWYAGHGLEEELWGRSGQIIHVSFDRPFKQDRTEVEKANDVLLMGWTREPNSDDLKILQDFKAKKVYIVGFGPKRLPALAEHVKLADAWFDTGYKADDRVVKFADGSSAGRVNLLSDVLNAWVLMGEVIAALTRRGKMPTIGKAFLYEDGVEWWDRYFQKQQFHEDFKIAPIPPGQIGRTYLDAIRGYIRKYERTQRGNVQKTVDLILQELAAGRKTVVTGMGHMTWAYGARDEAIAWAVPSGQFASFHYNLPYEAENYPKVTPDGALVLRIGYSGHHQEDDKMFKSKGQRVMLITAENPRPEWQLPKDLLTHIDMGFPFGDAVVEIKGYPIRILPPSGVMQLVAYETVNVGVLARLAQQKITPKKAS